LGEGEGEGVKPISIAYQRSSTIGWKRQTQALFPLMAKTKIPLKK